MARADVRVEWEGGVVAAAVGTARCLDGCGAECLRVYIRCEIELFFPEYGPAMRGTRTVYPEHMNYTCSGCDASIRSLGRDFSARGRWVRVANAIGGWHIYVLGWQQLVPSLRGTI